VHRNTADKARQRAIKGEMVANAKAMSQDNAIVAYAIVGLTRDGQARAAFDTGQILPLWAFPDTIAGILRQDIWASDIPEDFKRPFLDTAWKGCK
jgi:hypothetical protein